MAEPLYSSEYVDGARHVLMTHLLPRFASAELAFDGVAELPGAGPGSPHGQGGGWSWRCSTRGGGRAGGRWRSSSGSTAPTVPSGVAVGITDSIEELLDVVGGYVAEGYVRVKLKIEPGADVEPVRAVRERFGPDLMLQVDANGAYAARRRSEPGGARSVRAAAHRAAAGRGRPSGPCRAGPRHRDADLPGRVDHLPGLGDSGVGPRRLPRHQRQARSGGRLPRSRPDPRPGGRTGRGAVVRRDAGDRDRARRQHRPRGAAGLHPARGSLGLPPLLRSGT